eukprot:scaffold2192_cov82-Phaeocystis_antarctica.AAC.1
MNSAWSLGLEQYAACLGSVLHGCGTVRAPLPLLPAQLGLAMPPSVGALALLGELAASVQQRGSTAAVEASRASLELADTLTALTATQRLPHVESLVLRTVRELTGDAEASVTASTPLMEAGIDSLAATELSSRLRAATGLALSSTLVFGQPTPRAIAAHVLEQLAGAQCMGGPEDADDNDGGDGSLALLPPLEPLAGGVRPGEACPVSWNQSQLLTVHAGSGGAEAAYNIPLALWLRGPLAVGALRAALDALVARHAVLRTTFEVDADGGFVQRVHAAGGGNGGGDGGSTLLREAEAQSAAAAEAVALTEAALGFELLGAGTAVLRCLLVRVAGEARHLLLLTVHHVAFDGASTALLMRELGALYTLASGGTGEAAASLPSLRVQYVDFAAWQRGALPAHLGPYRAYWRAALREGALPPLELPLDFARPARQTFRGGSVPVALPAAMAARLAAVARAHGCTLFQLVLA